MSGLRISSQLLPMRCRQCDWQGELEVLCNVQISVWVAQLKTLHCPNCGEGWKKLSLVTTSPAKPAEGG